jgi:cobalamin biosynthesis protein CobD/CbiB
MVAQIYRYRRISNSIDRQKTKWVVFGFAAAIAALFITVLVGWLLALLRFGIPQVFYYLAGATVIYVSSLLLPLSIGVAIQRYRLWDIDVIIKHLV